MGLDLSNDNFDFEKVDITEKDYYDFLNYLYKHSLITEVNHSLPLNSITVTIDSDNDIDFGDYTDDIPDEVLIKNIFVEDNVTKIRLSTTKWFCCEDEIEKYYHGEYSHESIAYLACELQIYNEVISTKIVEGENSEFYVRVQFNNIDSFDFTDVFSKLGYSIKQVTIKNNSINQADFFFDESRIFNKENIKKFQEDKKRDVINEIFRDTNNSITLPSGNESQAGLWMFEDTTDELLSKFPKVDLKSPDNFNKEYLSFLEIPVENISDLFITISEFPDNEEPIETDNSGTKVAIRSGYACSETNKIYILENKSDKYDLFNSDEYNSLSLTTHSVSFNNNGKDYQYKFDIFKP